MAQRQNLSHRELGSLVAMASMGMIFGTLILTYLLTRTRHPEWPPIGVEPLKTFLPSLSTACIVASSLVIHMAMSSLQQGQAELFKKRWLIGVILGVAFVALQAGVLIDLQVMGIQLNSNLFTSMIYLFIVFHGLHMLAGLGWLAFVLKNSSRYSAQNIEVPKLASWFWHFLDVIWILLFVLLIWT